MFTVTRDLMLPTSVTGSWPRPSWYDANLRGRPLSEWMTDAAYREKFLDATAVVINEQERAGLDILTNGDYHLDADFGGRSWFYYPVERLAGLSATALEMTDPRYSGPPGTYLQEIMSAWRYPKVEGRLALRADLPLEYAKVWRVAQGRTDRPVKFGTVSAQTIVSVLANKGAYKEADLISDLSRAMNAELRALAAAGCKAIQIEDPLPHIVLSVNPDADRGWIDFLIDSFNEEVKGLDDVEVWIHTCWGNPGAQRVQDRTSYAESIEIYLERMHGDVWTVEAPGGDVAALVKLFEPYRGRLAKKIALGVISHRTVQVESVAEVAAAVRGAAAVIGPEHLAVTSDCGFGRQGVPRAVALYKTSALVQGTNVVRRELGLPERRVRSAEAALQVDAAVEEDAA
jgi:5-methyltetrahydropteroyltriglutamate--homocysteine methyltransferase